MPNCKKCNSHFPNRIEVNGEKRIVGGRKNCFNCSPLGPPRIKRKNQGDFNRTCELCSREYIYSHEKGHTEKLCNSCSVNSRRFLRKKKMVEYKGGKCYKCGYDKSTRALEFHHRDKKEKLFNVSGSHCIKWEKIKVELDKCDLVCSNCHKEIEELEDLNNPLSKTKIIEAYFQPRKPRQKIVCIVCQKEIVITHKGQIYCSNECSHKNKIKITATKEELEEMRKTKTITEISKIFGVSFNAVKRKCKKLGIVKSKNK